MQNQSELFDALISHALSQGAFKANIIASSEVETDKSFRELCASNACGVYGKCWMCPPDVGNIDRLMRDLLDYDHVLVYQTVSALEDSYDFEGMREAKKAHYKLTQSIRQRISAQPLQKVLHLGAGGCGVCDMCSKRTNEHCRYPELAMPSLEAYGINVSRLAAAAEMKYINGPNTVTYFGAVFFRV